jgi:hypothetical protein
MTVSVLARLQNSLNKESKLGESELRWHPQTSLLFRIRHAAGLILLGLKQAAPQWPSFRDRLGKSGTGDYCAKPELVFFRDFKEILPFYKGFLVTILILLLIEGAFAPS